MKASICRSLLRNWSLCWKKPQQSAFGHKKFPEESHRTTKHPSLQFALRTTFAGWVPDYETKTGGLEGLKKHYQDLSNKFGFKVAIPTDMLQRLTAYYATGQGDEPQVTAGYNGEICPSWMQVTARMYYSKLPTTLLTMNMKKLANSLSLPYVRLTIVPKGAHPKKGPDHHLLLCC